ncbi:replication-relaxation family protein [Niallia sp. FSL W8-0635]|uniref:replication-relaxation family protein n=1 Tax=Niallia sp. FSL W8-0635 TaxID=2975337 RepID=UPI0030FB6251
MAYLLGYDLTDYDIKLIECLVNYRGVKPYHFAVMKYGKNFTESQEKTIYKYLRKLLDQKLIVKYKLQDGSEGSMYYLTSKGYELAKDLFNIEEGKRGEGWINENGFTNYGDFPYELFSPPLEQAPHHLLLVDFLFKLKSINTTFIEHRINLYSAVTYGNSENKFRFRPDAEIRLENNRTYAIEIDRGSENHEQLCKKFRTYRHYYETAKQSALDVRHAGIIFIVEDKRKKHGMKRRWKNICAAFIKEVGDYHKDVNLIMTTVSDTSETILFEINRKNYEQRFINKLSTFLKKKGNQDVNLYLINDLDNDYKQIITTNMAESNAFYVNVYITSQTFEANVYSKFMNVYRQINAIKNQEVVKGLEFRGFRKAIIYGNEMPYLINDIGPYELDKEFNNVFREFNDNVHYYRVDDVLV